MSDLPPPPLTLPQRVRALLGPAPSYALTRFAILRLVGLVYFVAFLVMARQIVPLAGHDGLTPADAWMRMVGPSGFKHYPSLFWWRISDGLLLAVSWTGAALAFAVLCGFANTIVMLVLWALYMSLVHVGQVWTGYGWEIELLEAGFLAAFLCPIVDPRPFPPRPPPTPVIWLYRWLICRIMLGAGLIKLRGDPCWRELTCLDYHYETQPVPSPLSPLFHHLPHWVHAVGVLYNHLCELVCPFFVFGPRLIRHTAGALLLVFQLALIASGNLSFLNWLTIVPILACFDDSLLARLSPRRLRAAAERTAAGRSSLRDHALGWTLVVVVAFLSIGPVKNLVSAQQMMNTSFDPLSLVNTYGAFGSVGKERDEVILEGTYDETPDDDARWQEYEFPCKPGDPDRRPCLVAPWHYRLDWQLWFAGMAEPGDEPWIVSLIWKLLHADRGARSLLAKDPFGDRPPRFIRVLLYRYEMKPWGQRGWWTRTRLRQWLPPLSADMTDIHDFLVHNGWAR